MNQAIRQMTVLRHSSNERVASPRERPLRSARLQILSATVATLNDRLIQQDAEAGFGILDGQARVRCEFSDREIWKAESSEAAELAVRATFNLLGVPGLSQMRQIEDLLAQATMRAENWESRASIGFAGVTAVLSAVTWAVVPRLAASAIGRVIPLSSRAAFGARVAAISAESVALRLLEVGLIRLEEGPLQRLDASLTWSDLIGTIEDFLASDLDSPRLYYRHLVATHAGLSARMLVALEALASER